MIELKIVDGVLLYRLASLEIETNDQVKAHFVKVVSWFPWQKVPSENTRSPTMDVIPEDAEPGKVYHVDAPARMRFGNYSVLEVNDDEVMVSKGTNGVSKKVSKALITECLSDIYDPSPQTDADFQIALGQHGKIKFWRDTKSCQVCFDGKLPMDVSLEKLGRVVADAYTRGDFFHG